MDRPKDGNKVKDLTVVIACKNRTRNLKFCLESINTCTPRPHCILIDFGSDTPLQFDYKWLRIIRVDRKTEVFHKARAINIGIRNVKTKKLCVTDADQVFQENFFGIVNNTIERENRPFVLCWTHRLWKLPSGTVPENIREDYPNLLDLAKKVAPKLYGDGCCHATYTNWFLRVRGYEEKFIGWGYEDSDMTYRAHWVDKLRLINIKNMTSTIHFPHPKRNNPYYSSKYKDSNAKLYRQRRSRKILLSNDNRRWGRI